MIQFSYSRKKWKKNFSNILRVWWNDKNIKKALGRGNEDEVKGKVKETIKLRYWCRAMQFLCKIVSKKKFQIF